LHRPPVTAAGAVAGGRPTCGRGRNGESGAADRGNRSGGNVRESENPDTDTGRPICGFLGGMLEF
jgi:hypothetical protein